MLRREFVTSFNENEKIWSGISCNSPYNVNASIGEVILNTLSMMPKKVVQINDTTSREISAAELTLMTIRASQNFETLGYKRGDVIGFVVTNGDFMAPLIFGAFLNGIIINPIAPFYDRDAIRHLFGITKPKVIFCDPDVHQTVKEAVDPCTIPIFTIRNAETEFLKPTGKEEWFIPPQLDKEGDCIAAILYTSGSEGEPKGISITHRALITTSLQYSFPSSTVMYPSVDLNWISGLDMLIATSMRCCTRIITEQDFTPEHFLHLIEKYRVTALSTNPAQMAWAVNCQEVQTRDLSSLETCICAGSPLSASLAAQVKIYAKNIHILFGYGLTEIVMFISMAFDRDGSVGQLAANLKAKILDDHDNPLGVGGAGEVCVKPPFKLYGFYGDTEATKKIIDANGWLRTGDVGYFDQQGSLHIVDRKKEIFRYTIGYLLSPTQIELVIMEIPDVVECCVFGVPNELFFNLAAAAIVKKAGSTLSEDDVHNYIAARLKDQHKLRGGVFFVASLPKTVTGKICRRKVKDIQ